MSLWQPTWRVIVGGTTYTSTVMANLTATKGRSNIYTQPQASYVSMQLLETAQASIAININDAFTVEIQNSAGTWVTICAGKITDVDVAISRSGSLLMEQRISLIGLGRLSILAGIKTTGVLDEALDGAQMLQALRYSEVTRWMDEPSALAWAAYPAALTWADIAGDFGSLDTGSYPLAARASAETDVYSLASAIANSGAGYLYEDADGKICYADGQHRSAYFATHGYTTISAGNASAIGLKMSKKRGNIRNLINLSYGAGSASSVSAQDATSILAYGSLNQGFTTTLRDLADATAQAAFYLALRAYPLPMLESITFDLESAALSTTDRDALLGVFMGMPVNFTDLPANMNSGSFQGFIEGWTFNAGFKRLSLTLLLSPVAFSLRPMTWASVSVAEKWNTLDATLDYAHAIIAA